MAAEGAVRSVTEVLQESGADFDPDAYISAVNGYMEVVIIIVNVLLKKMFGKLSARRS